QEMVAIDLDAATMDVLYLDTDKEVRSMAPFTEGKLLLVAYDYNTDPITVSLMAYDIESQELTELGVMPNDSWSGPTGICYDEARGKIYYVQSGSVWRMDVSEEGLGEPEEFGDMPLEIYSDATPVLMGDLYIVSSYEGVVGRDVTLDKLPEQRLRVSNASYSEPIRQAYYSFTDAHPEYMVSISSGSDTTNLVQDMMNRSAETDIYTISSTDKVYQSLIERGFMAELGGSEKLTAYVDPMYDIIKNYVTRDGQLYAVPLGSYASVMTLNKKLLTEKFGYDEADLPTTWPEMFELLSDLASGKMEDVPEATLLGQGYILRDVKATIFNMMLQDYFLWLDQSEENLKRGSEVLIACCEVFEQIDWAGFGLPEEYEENEEGWMYDPETILMSTSSLGMYRYNYEEQQEPWPLAVAEGEDRLVGMSVTMAFVNPYSEHRDAAIEYLECALDSVQPVDRMCMDPTINEPVENSYYQESLADIDKSIADIEKSLEETEDEEQREMLTQQLEEMQQWREEYERDYRYDVSEEGIAGYRAHDSQFMIQKSSVWSSGAYEQVDQYIGGTMSAQQLASELEKTLQMQRLEGI
ncbi:MAG TPA: carbohydrate ABC transporter substrate-binding protein, partial [Candidatus Ventricola gallistercoris]|nr:carbohydrate ABC transporter substrate-binding protein [Candidatus Ventricola gallistercoris]